VTTIRTNTIVIGGGQAGLALSHCLTGLGVEHVVLEAGRVAQRWHERWDSLRLLTPNWMTRLPGWTYHGPDPDGFMTAAETAAFFAAYARSFAAPVLERTPVRRVRQHGDRFVVEGNGVTFGAVNVVVATGWADRPAVPAAARHLSGGVAQLTPTHYRRPADLPDGAAVLVVGASATGVQLADELHRSGRPVTLAVGSHTRMPRRYRGRDAFWWLDRTGSFDKTIDDCPDPVAARNEPSLQLVGRPAGAGAGAGWPDLDLPSLHAAGVRLVGRLRSIDGTRVGFAPDLGATAAAADGRMARSLARIDAAIDRLGLPAEPVGSPPARLALDDDPPTGIDLAAAGIRTVVWATGYRRAYPWLGVPVLDRRGEIVQRRGVTPVPGLYVLGQRFQHHRNSNFIDGVGRDAAYVAIHLAHRQSHRHRRPPPTPPQPTPPQPTTECLAS